MSKEVQGLKAQLSYHWALIHTAIAIVLARVE